jgi:hypothetical protein
MRPYDAGWRCKRATQGHFKLDTKHPPSHLPQSGLERTFATAGHAAASTAAVQQRWRRPRSGHDAGNAGLGTCPIRAVRPAYPATAGLKGVCVGLGPNGPHGVDEPRAVRRDGVRRRYVHARWLLKVWRPTRNLACDVACAASGFNPRIRHPISGKANQDTGQVAHPQVTTR